MIRVWKGLSKPLAVASMAAAAVIGFFHYTRVGPNEVTEKDEQEAAEAAKAAKAATSSQPEEAHHE